MRRKQAARYLGTTAPLWRPIARPRPAPAAAAPGRHLCGQPSWRGSRLLRGGRRPGSPCSTSGLGGGDLLQRVRLKLLGQYLLRQLAVLHGLLVAPPAEGKALSQLARAWRVAAGRLGSCTCAGQQLCAA